MGVTKAHKVLVETTAMAMFKRLNGPGDGGSPNDYYAQSCSQHKDWERLARWHLKQVKNAERSAY